MLDLDDGRPRRRRSSRRVGSFPAVLAHADGRDCGADRILDRDRARLLRSAVRYLSAARDFKTARDDGDRPSVRTGRGRRHRICARPTERKASPVRSRSPERRRHVWRLLPIRNSWALTVKEGHPRQRPPRTAFCAVDLAPAGSARVRGRSAGATRCSSGRGADPRARPLVGCSSPSISRNAAAARWAACSHRVPILDVARAPSLLRRRCRIDRASPHVRTCPFPQQRGSATKSRNRRNTACRFAWPWPQRVARQRCCRCWRRRWATKMCWRCPGA